MARRSITETIYLEVRFAVLSGVYLPGQILDRDELSHVYGCKPPIVVDALNVLVIEGYLDLPRRGAFGVRVWRAAEIDDLCDIRSSMMGMAAARAAERRTEIERNSMLELIGREASLDPLSAEHVERQICESVAAQIELIKAARVATISEMARSMAPNFLLRKAVWMQNQTEMQDARQGLANVVGAVSARAPRKAEKAMLAFIENARGSLHAAVEAYAHGNAFEYPIISRIDCHALVRERAFDAGGREPGLDGRIIPFGVPQAR
jgi:DNA-binding GntR family transcriptional regulator